VAERRRPSPPGLRFLIQRLTASRLRLTHKDKDASSPAAGFAAVCAGLLAASTNCIQWVDCGRRVGRVSLARLIEHAGPAPEASTWVFYAMDDRADRRGGPRRLLLRHHSAPASRKSADDPGAGDEREPLPVEFGAPLRLRIEAQLGFKMVKWIKGIEFVAGTRDVGMGMGGWREDQQFYASAAGI